MIQISLPANSPDNLELSSGTQTADMPDELITLTFTSADWNSAQTVTLTLAGLSKKAYEKKSIIITCQDKSILLYSTLCLRIIHFYLQTCLRKR